MPITFDVGLSTHPLTPMTRQLEHDVSDSIASVQTDLE